MVNKFDNGQTIENHVDFKKDLDFIPSTVKEETLNDSIYILNSRSCGGIKVVHLDGGRVESCE